MCVCVMCAPMILPSRSLRTLWRSASLNTSPRSPGRGEWVSSGPRGSDFMALCSHLRKAKEFSSQGTANKELLLEAHVLL